jgi:hypothetical protein
LLLASRAADGDIGRDACSPDLGIDPSEPTCEIFLDCSDPCK